MPISVHGVGPLLRLAIEHNICGIDIEVWKRARLAAVNRRVRYRGGDRRLTR